MWPFIGAPEHTTHRPRHAFSSDCTDDKITPCNVKTHYSGWATERISYSRMCPLYLIKLHHLVILKKKQLQFHAHIFSFWLNYWNRRCWTLCQNFLMWCDRMFSGVYTQSTHFIRTALYHVHHVFVVLSSYFQHQNTPSNISSAQVWPVPSRLKSVVWFVQWLPSLHCEFHYWFNFQSILL